MMYDKTQIKNIKLEDLKTIVSIWFPKNNFDYNEIKEFYGDYEVYQFERTLVDLSRKRKLVVRLVELGDFRIINKNKFMYTIGIGLETENTIFTHISKDTKIDSLFKCKIDSNSDIIVEGKLDKDKLAKHIVEQLPLNMIR